MRIFAYIRIMILFPAIKFYTFNVCLIVTGMKEVNPKETTRAYAFEMWMNAPDAYGHIVQDTGCYKFGQDKP